MDKVTKIVLAILLFLCLLHFPYSYYVFVRWSVMVGFIFLAYLAYKDKQSIMAIVFVGLAILFQPFEKIALGRTLWNVVDIIVGVGLIVSLFLPSKKNSN